ncbi:Lsr2 protein [Micrococcus luteus]|uniref:Lsr2 protein n=1 Tax=Micrococcus luteus TaxID=1270 RepID=A0ABD7M5B2_MICLU|nr:Lsr2 family protein [Micrococcus luteus]MCV7462800.1 Lsr2 family protein [Micrococcus luteus]MCV7467115.1 Lsr2 family protein [Micrococcus luteus]SHL33652.1 Lsr2 protein [Micrococcus luteus]
MAEKTVLIDDLDGKTPAERVYFYADGKRYQIDLSTENESKLQDVIDAYHKALEPYMTAKGVKSVDLIPVTAQLSSSRTTRRSSSKSDYDPSEVRAWLMENGHKVSDRGRIPGELVDLWRARDSK